MTPRSYRLGRRQAAVDRTRARILKAARAVLARGGELSIDAVARRARVTRATVYQRFGSRPKLLQALFDDLAHEGSLWDLGKVFQVPDPSLALAQFIAKFGHFWTVHRALQRRLTALGALDAVFHRTLRARQEWRREGLKVIVARVRARQREGAQSTLAAHDAIDLLFTLTSFDSFDTLAGTERTPEQVTPLVMDVARKVLGITEV
jgi:AcrR family transcriptional regulator